MLRLGTEDKGSGGGVAGGDVGSRAEPGRTRGCTRWVCLPSLGEQHEQNHSRGTAWHSTP